jgi:hypothetical protein
MLGWRAGKPDVSIFSFHVPTINGGVLTAPGNCALGISTIMYTIAESAMLQTVCKLTEFTRNLQFAGIL